MTRDCRTCAHNTYREIKTEWVSCSHPVTLAKIPKLEKGDPAFVDYRTSDVPVSRISEIGFCPAYEAQP